MSAFLNINPNADQKGQERIEKILMELGDDFTPEKFKAALEAAHKNEPQPDLVYEFDEDFRDDV